MQEKYQQQGLVIISVNVDNSKALADEFLAEVPANFNVFYDPKGKVARKFKLKVFRSIRTCCGRKGFRGWHAVVCFQNVLFPS